LLNIIHEIEIRSGFINQVNVSTFSFSNKSPIIPRSIRAKQELDKNGNDDNNDQLHFSDVHKSSIEEKKDIKHEKSILRNRRKQNRMKYNKRIKTITDSIQNNSLDTTITTEKPKNDKYALINKIKNNSLLKKLASKIEHSRLADERRRRKEEERIKKDNLENELQNEKERQRFWNNNQLYYILSHVKINKFNPLSFSPVVRAANIINQYFEQEMIRKFLILLSFIQMSCLVFYFPAFLRIYFRRGYQYNPDIENNFYFERIDWLFTLDSYIIALGIFRIFSGFITAMFVKLDHKIEWLVFALISTNVVFYIDLATIYINYSHWSNCNLIPNHLRDTTFNMCTDIRWIIGDDIPPNQREANNAFIYIFIFNLIQIPIDIILTIMIWILQNKNSKIAKTEKIKQSIQIYGKNELLKTSEFFNNQKYETIKKKKLELLKNKQFELDLLKNIKTMNISQSVEKSEDKDNQIQSDKGIWVLLQEFGITDRNEIHEILFEVFKFDEERIKLFDNDFNLIKHTDKSEISYIYHFIKNQILNYKFRKNNFEKKDDSKME
jgi:hypothetical protein